MLAGAFNVSSLTERRWRGFPSSVTKEQRRDLKRTAQNAVNCIFISSILITADVTFIVVHAMGNMDKLHLDGPGAVTAFSIVLGFCCLWLLLFLLHLYVEATGGAKHELGMETVEYQRLFGSVAERSNKVKPIPQEPPVEVLLTRA